MDLIQSHKRVYHALYHKSLKIKAFLGIFLIYIVVLIFFLVVLIFFPPVAFGHELTPEALNKLSNPDLIFLH